VSAQPDFEDEDLLPDNLAPKAKVPMVRSKKQIEAARKAAERAEAERLAAESKTAAQENAKRLAQIVNLHIGGYSLAQIGAEIGATEAEVDRMLMSETARYVKTQPALRTYVRNFISEHYLALLEAVHDQAVDQGHPKQLEYVAAANKVLAQMGRLHGAEAPTQAEVKVESAPEAVNKVVEAIAQAVGRGYDTDIFDLDEDDIHEAHVSASEATVVSGNAVEESDGDDEL
jgi:hypothetical protein